MKYKMDIFFSSIRKYLVNRLSQDQVDGFNTLVNHDYHEELSYTIQELAYALATTWHETAHTMQPIAEYGRGRGRAYGRPHPVTGKVYYGRGYVQLTHYDNYVKMDKVFGTDFATNPEKVMDPEYAAKIMFYGMRHGSFTGKKLTDYFKSTSNPVGARKIINGTDKDDLIAGYYRSFLHALSDSKLN